MWAGCGGGGDAVPDPDSDPTAATGIPNAATAPPAQKSDDSGESVAESAAADTAPAEAPQPRSLASRADAGGPPAETPAPAEEGADAKGESSATADMLAIGGGSGGRGAAAAPAPGGAAPGAAGPGGPPGAVSGPGQMSMGPPPAPGTPGAPGMPGMPGMPGGSSGPAAPGAAGGSEMQRRMMAMNGGPGAPGMPPMPGAAGGRGMPGMPAMPGMPGAGGSADDNAPVSFKRPDGAVKAFLKALKKKDIEALSEATAKRAGRDEETSPKYRKIFTDILALSISDDELASLAARLDGFTVSSMFSRNSTRRVGVILMKSIKRNNSPGSSGGMGAMGGMGGMMGGMMGGGGYLQCTIDVRTEKEGWKVVDIGPVYEMKNPGMNMGSRKGNKPR